MQDNNYLKHLKEILRQKPHSKLYLSLSYEMVRLGENEEARDILRSGIKHNPFPQAMLALAQLYLDEGMLSEVKKELLEILKTYPDNTAAKKGLDRVYALLGETPEEQAKIVIETVSAPKEIQPEHSSEASQIVTAVKTDSVEAILRQADDFIKTGSYLKAMDIYNSIMLKYPENKQALQLKNELKVLMKLSGFDKKTLELKLNGFLAGIAERFGKRRRKEKLNVFMDKIRQRFNPAWQT
jgi:tetratricopeptide (TPR) repeat protein